MEQEQKRVTLQTPEFQSWLKGVQAILDKHQALHAWKEFYHAEELGKFIRVWRRSEQQEKEGCRGSCMGFIAMQDNETKTLGKVLAGDVLKPASWKVPAKHSRGNIFNADNGLVMMNHHGPAYLKYAGPDREEKTLLSLSRNGVLRKNLNSPVNLNQSDRV